MTEDVLNKKDFIEKENIDKKKVAPKEGKADPHLKKTEKSSKHKKLEKDTTKQKLVELQDKYLRLSAEFDNYRKRTLKEKIELTKTAGEEIFLSLLPVMDDFERGIQTLDKVNDTEAVKEGLIIIYKKFREFLHQKGVKEIEAVNKEFNVDYHEAITKIPAPSEELKGKVVDVIEKGYCLNDKVIRFSKVVIGE